MENYQVPEIKKNSSGIGNRSFLHRNVDSKLEGLALKRKTLPLQLIRSDIVVSIENGMQDSGGVPITPTLSDSSKQFNFKESLYEQEDVKTAYGNFPKQEETSKRDEEQELNTEQISSKDSIGNDKPTANQENINEKFDLEIIFEQANKISEINEIHNNKNNNNNNNNNNKNSSNNHDDGMNNCNDIATSGIHFKVKPKWGFTRNVMMHYVPNKTKRSKKLNKSRIRKVERLNNAPSPVVNVSKPTNFVYLAGTARWTWLNDPTLNSPSGPVITHEEKFAKLSMVGKEINSNGDNKMQLDYKELSTEPRANSSFLWSNLSKRSIQIASKEDSSNQDENYDDVGILSPSTKSTGHEEEHVDDVYDDVGPSITPLTTSLSSTIDYNDEQVYDDVISPLCSETTFLNSVSQNNRNSNDQNQQEEEEDFIYMQNNYSSVEEDADDEDTLYDDVGTNCQSRVNSLYAGGTQLESEWEDLEEILPLDQVVLRKNNEESQCAQQTKKKISCRWSRKVRRQRSKALRKNSMRTSSQAVRISSLSLHSDTASDDSNYETLCSESMSESTNGIEPPAAAAVQNEAPVRPVPPPPRESSLTETFGKRMKILKRTWSITKGSLGRMRRRTSTTTTNELDGGGSSNNTDGTTAGCENCQSDSRKLSQGFNFKKHFQRNVSSHSTFYLENENEISKTKNNHSSIDDIYIGNQTNWFGGSGDCWRIDTQSIEQKSMTYSSDDYNMLAEEPLYQFYAAATVRGAFQADSDSNYGGEDDSNSSLSLASTTDLARPGHRTLWCETPQVKNSTLLENLSADDKKLQEAKFEIVTSEASYLNSLRVLVNEFLINHELVYEVLSVNDRERLFGKVPGVLIASEKFLGELESAWRQDPMLVGLPSVLLQHAERCSQIYIDYCSNQVSIDATLKELKGKKSNNRFVDTVTRIEAHPACHSLSLHSFLMLPMQRVTRLPLLADAVLSKLSSDHEERLDWERVVSHLGKVVTECNEAARAAGRQIEMETLSRKLVYSAKVSPIDLRERYLVRSGPVTQMLVKPGSEYVLTFRKKYHKNALYLLLLTDYILVAKLKTNTGQEDTYIVIDAAKRSLVELEKVPDDSPFAGRHAMILTLLENHNGRHTEYILSCQNTTERERWLDAVSPPKPNLVGETLYETWDCPQVMALYSYTPTQPDELTLQPGDVINVLRKMADGWNHGEKLVGGQQGWFPGNFVKEVASEHVRARNLRQRHRLLALSESLVQQRATSNRSQ